MQNFNSPTPSTWSGIRPGVKRIFFSILAIGAIYFAWSFGLIPGLSSSKSKEVEKSNISKDAINSAMATEMLPVPNLNNKEYADVEERPEIRLMNWVWFGNASIFSANGGSTTMKNSLMDEYGVNLRMITNNSVAEMKREQLAFVNEFANGNKNPSSGIHFVTLMGDGLPSYISAMNPQIEKANGKEYCLKAIGIVGFSMGEDCIVGPQSWKDNPQSMRGALISAVIGDGDWGLGIRFAGDNGGEKEGELNGIKVNPDPNSYDPDAINFIPAPEDDFLKAAEDVIANRIVSLDVKDKNGKLTGKTIEKQIDGAATWFPGDRNLFNNTNLVKVVSTSDYPNQMGTMIVGCDKWMKENSKLVVSFLSASLIASNQIKQYPQWYNYACDLAPKVFCVSPDDCSETSSDWKKFAKPHGAMMQNTEGVQVSAGGTQMANLADNKKYFGLKGGNNYYRSVYNYFSNVIKDLNPAGFMDNVKELTPYEEAVDLTYLKQVNIEAGQVTKVDYSTNTGEEFANRSWKIEFATNSSAITPAGETALEELFVSISIAENALVNIIGHTDDIGDDALNLDLSLKRAKAVKMWLMDRSNNSFPSERFTVDGKGEAEPLVPNLSKIARAQNRRVEIALLK